MLTGLKFAWSIFFILLLFRYNVSLFKYHYNSQRKLIEGDLSAFKSFSITIKHIIYKTWDCKFLNCFCKKFLTWGIYVLFLLDLFIIALCNSSVINGASFPLIYFLLINLVPLVFFYTPWKHQKTIIFSISSGGIERHEWYEMFIENAEDWFLETFKIWST